MPISRINVMFVSIILTAFLGVLLTSAPQTVLRADMRHDPKAISKTVKIGKVLIGFAIFLVLYSLFRHLY